MLFTTFLVNFKLVMNKNGTEPKSFTTDEKKHIFRLAVFKGYFKKKTLRRSDSIVANYRLRTKGTRCHKISPRTREGKFTAELKLSSLFMRSHFMDSGLKFLMINGLGFMSHFRQA